MKNLSGLYEGMSNEEYHAAPGLSNTGLTELARSPWHYYSRFLDPSRPERERKAGQFEGTIAHCAILEPNEFMRRYVVTPSNAPRRPTAAQWNAKNPSPESVQAMAWWSNWEAENEGREVVSHDDYSRVLRQAESVRRIREVRELFEHGKAELSAFATADGVLKKCRPDWTAYVGAGDVILIDVKTVGDAKPDEMARHIGRKGYYRQAAHYWRTFEQASGLRVASFKFLAVESEWPYAASLTQLDDASLQVAMEEVRDLAAMYAECLKSGRWPGYDEAQVVSLPAYLFNEEQTQIEVEYV